MSTVVSVPPTENASGEASVELIPQEISFHCPQCGGGLSVPMSYTGVTGPCPLCATPITAPAQTQRETVAPGRKEFRAAKRIIPSDDFKDDEWKERYQNDLRSWKKRKMREKKWHDFLESRTCRSLRGAGILCLIAAIFGAIAFVYWDKKLGARDAKAHFEGAAAE